MPFVGMPCGLFGIVRGLQQRTYASVFPFQTLLCAPDDPKLLQISLPFCSLYGYIGRSGRASLVPDWGQFQ